MSSNVLQSVLADYDSRRNFYRCPKENSVHFATRIRFEQLNLLNQNLMKHVLTISFLAISVAAVSQVEIDRRIDFTGTGSNAKITGIDEVSAAKDAVSAEVIQSNALTYAAAGGVADAYTVTLLPAVASYTAGQLLTFRANAPNTGASTVDVNGLGVKPIMKNGDQDLAADDIKNGQIVTVIYDGTNFQMVSHLGNAAGGGGGGGADDVRTLIYTTDGF
jgi:hypothetical protein